MSKSKFFRLLDQSHDSVDISHSSTHNIFNLQRLCSQMFPKAFPTPPNPRTEATNAKFKGWDVELNRLFFANGKREPHSLIDNSSAHRSYSR